MHEAYLVRKRENKHQGKIGGTSERVNNIVIRTRKKLKITLCLFLGCFSITQANVSYINIGPNVKFKNGLKLFSIGIELSIWNVIDDFNRTSKGIDIGVELFRNIEVAESQNRRKSMDAKFRNNFRCYSEFQLGRKFYGMSAGPFFEMQRGFFETKYNLGVQSTLWANMLVGLDIRPEYGLDGFDYSYGAYGRIPICLGGTKCQTAP